MDVTVVALIDQPGATSGFVNIWFDEQTARELMTDGTYVGFVELQAVPGVSPQQLRDRVAAILDPERYRVRTGDQVRADAKGAYTQFLDIFRESCSRSRPSAWWWVPSSSTTPSR